MLSKCEKDAAQNTMLGYPCRQSTIPHKENRNRIAHKIIGNMWINQFWMDGCSNEGRHTTEFIDIL